MLKIKISKSLIKKQTNRFKQIHNIKQIDLNKFIIYCVYTWLVFSLLDQYFYCFLLDQYFYFFTQFITVKFLSNNNNMK